MFESVVTTVLNKFLGDYVDNLEHKQLNLGIFQGYLGTLELHIPWRNLKNEAVRVIISDLFLLAGPRVETEYNENLERSRETKAKRERLETAELFNTSLDSKLEKDLGQESFVTQLITKIVDNLQVIIKNIHIRFEDATSNKRRMYSVGIVLKNLTAVSTDADWQETFLVNPQTAVHKLLNLEELGVYWETDKYSLKNLSFDGFVEAFRDLIEGHDHSYILKPVSAIGKAVLLKSYQEGRPKTLVDLAFDRFALNVNYEQYVDILSALNSLSMAQRSLPFRKYFPSGHGPLDLFRYAITCYQSKIHERNRRRSWEYILERRSDRRTYISLFTNQLIAGQPNETDAERLAALEFKLTFDDIMAYRTIARRLVQKSNLTSTQPVANRFWSWLGYKDTKTVEVMNEEDMKELYETIDFSESSGKVDLPPETVLMQFNFKLASGSLSITDRPPVSEPIVSLVFQDLLAKFVKRPKSLRVETSLKDLQLFENLMTNSHFKQVIRMKPERRSTDQPLFALSFDEMPTNTDADSQIRIRLLPLFIVVNVVAANKLMDFVLNDHTRPLIEALKSEAGNVATAFGSRTRVGLQHAIESHKSTDLDVEIEAPIILFPLDPIFIADLGRLIAKSDLVKRKDKLQIAEIRQSLTAKQMSNLQSMLYDKLKLSLQEMKIYYSPTVTEWQELVRNPDIVIPNKHKVLDQVDMDLTIESTIIPTCRDIPKTRITGSLPQIQVYMTDQKLALIMNLLELLFPPVVKPLMKVTRRLSRLKLIPKPQPIVDTSEEFFDAAEDEEQLPGLVEHEDFMLKLSVGKVGIHLSKSLPEGQESPRISLLAQTLQANLNIFPSHLKIGILLTDLSLNSGAAIILEGSLSDSDSPVLCQAEIVIPDKHHHDFIDRFDRLKLIVNASFSSLVLHSDPSRIAEVLDYFLNEFLAAIPSGPDTEENGLLPSTKMKFGFNLSLFTINMIDSMKPLACIRLQTATATVDLLDAGRLAVVARLSQFNIDGISDALHPERLVYFVGDSVFDLKYSTRGVNDELPSGRLVNTTELSAGSMNVVYHPVILKSVTRSLISHLAVLDVVSKNATDKQQAAELPDSAALNQLNVSLQSPVVHFPLPDGSNVSTRVYLGELLVKNEFAPFEDGIDQRLNITLSSVHASLYDGDSRLFEVVKRFTIPLRLLMPHSAHLRSYSDTEIDCTVDSILLQASRDHIRTILETAGFVSASVSTILSELPSRQPSSPVLPVTEDRFTFDGDLIVKELRMELIDADETITTIASISDLNVNAVIHTHKGLHVETHFDAASIKDLRQESDTEFFMVRESDVPALPHMPIKSRPLLAHYESAPDGSSELNIYLEHPRIFLHFDTVYYLLKFAREATNTRTLFIIPTNETSAIISNASRPNNVPPITVVVNISKVTATMPAVRTDSSWEGLAVIIGCISFTQREELNLLLDGVQISTQDLATGALTNDTLVEEFNACIAIKRNPNDKGTEDEVMCGTFEPIHLTASLKDINLILQILSSVTTAQVKYPLPSQPISATSGSVAPVIRGISQKGEIGLETIRLSVIDDSLRIVMPLLEVVLGSIDVGLADWSSSLHMEGQSQIYCNYFNPRISSWEPILEPLQLHIRHGFDVEGDLTATVISAANGAEFILAKSALERVLNFVSKIGGPLSSAAAPLAGKKRDTHSEYIMGNYTPHKILVSWPASDETKTIAPNHAEPFGVGEWRKHRKRGLNITPRTLNVHPTNDAYQDLISISVDRDGIFEFPLFDRTGSQEIGSVVVAIELVDGLKHVLVRGSHLLHNQSSMPLIVGSTLVEAGGKAGLLSPKLDLRISDEFELVNPEENPELFLLSHEQILVMRYRSQRDQSLLYLMLSVDAPLAGPVYDLYLSEPLLVDNCLPVSARLQLSQESGRQVYGLQENSIKSLTNVDTYAPFQFVLSIPALGYFSTEPLQIHNRFVDASTVLRDQDGRTLQCLISRRLGKRGQHIITIAAQFIVINQTEMKLTVRTAAKRGVDTQLPFTVNESSYCLFSHAPGVSPKSRVQIRIDDSDWSLPVSLEAVGAEFEIDCKSLITSRWYSVAGTVSFGEGKFAATRILTISPRFIMLNQLDEDVVLTDGQSAIVCAAGKQTALSFAPTSLDKVTIKTLKSAGATAEFDTRATRRIYLREVSINPASEVSLTTETRLFRLGRNYRQPTFFLVLSVAESWPYRISNCTSLELAIKQRDTNRWYPVLPNSVMDYALDDPSNLDPIVDLVIENHKELKLDLSEIGTQTSIRYKNEIGMYRKIGVKISTEGPVVVIEVKELAHPRVLVHSSMSSFSSAHSAEASAGETALDASPEKPLQEFVIKIPHIGVSLINDRLEEILYLFLKEARVRYGFTENFVSYGLTIQWIQIDNQAFDWEHPMLLYPSIVSKRNGITEHPCLQVAMIQSKEQKYGVSYIKYFAILLQEMSIEVGEDLLARILDYTNLKYLESSRVGVVEDGDLSLAPYSFANDVSELLFFEFFQLHPIKLNLTFSTTEKPNTDKGIAAYNPFRKVVDLFTQTFGNISDAPLKFNALLLTNLLSRRAALSETVVEHYKQQGISQIHKLLGAADFLGNPVGLVSSLGSGVTDLFYEPYQGFVSDRPQDIGIGLVRGGVSLVSKTIAGVSGTVSKFTGSLAKGLSVITFDKEYQHKRRIDNARNRPRHALSGVTQGVKQLYTGVKAGLAGVLEKPIEGAKEGGVGGFFKGLGVGIVGAVTKPVIGVIDMTSAMTEGIRGSAEDSDSTVTQVRLPRVVPYDDKIRPFDTRGAFGQSLLAGAIGASQIRCERYVAHVDVPRDQALLIASERALYHIRINDLKIIWSIPLADMKEISSFHDKIFLIAPASSNSSLISAAASHATGTTTKTFLSIDPESGKWFCQVISDFLKSK